MTMPPGAVDESPTRPAEQLTPFDRALTPARTFLRWLGLALLAVMIALPVLQVSLRAFTSVSFIGAGELTRFMLICVVFLALPYTVASGASIRMEELTANLPRRLQCCLRIVITLTAALAFAFAAYSVALATYRNLNNSTPTLGIPYWVFFSAAFVGLLFAAIESALQLVKHLHGQQPYVTFAEEQPPHVPPVI
jgi:TRAP-type C4-dicarboxylate transport system permease small subunit